MSAPRLSSELYVKAHLRRCAAAGLNATIVRRGDDWGGALLVRVNLLGAGFLLFSQTRDAAGEIAWLRVAEGRKMSEAESDAYIARQVAYDPDLWVIEIDDRSGANPFAGRLL